MRLFLWRAAKASITFSLSNSCVRSFCMASMATLWSFLFDIGFLTHVFMCQRQEKLRSHAAVLTGNAVAMTPILFSSGHASLYRSMDTKITTTYFLASRQNPAVLQVVLPGEVRGLSQFRIRRMH